MLRRSMATVVATATVALGLGVGPLATPALAATPWSDCGVDPAGGTNAGTANVTLTTATPGEIVSTDQVKLVPPAGSGLAEIQGALTNVSPPSLTKMAASFSLDVEAPTGYTVTVYDGTNALKGTCGTYTLTNAEGLTASSISAPTRGAGSTTANVTIAGTGFAKGMTVAFRDSANANDPALTWTTTGTTVHQLTGTLAVGGGAQLGAHTVALTSFGGSPVTSIANGLTVTAAPTVTSASPTSLGQGATSRTVTINGTGFQSGAQVALLTGGTQTAAPGVTVGTPTFVSATQLTAPVTVSATATTGTLDLKVTNPDAGSATGTGALTVTAQPVVTSVTPRTKDQGTTGTTLTITGTGFDTTGTATAFSFPSTGVTVTARSVSGTTSATITVDVADTAALGDRALTALNPDGGTSTCAACFGVSAKPVVSSVSPPTLARGALQTVTVTGSGFEAGIGQADVSFGAGITVGTVSRTSATQLTADLTVAGNAAQGDRTVSVTNPAGGGVGTNATAFSVTAFTVTSTTPSSAGNTGNQTVTVNGSGFTAGMNATVTLVPHGTHPASQGNVVATTVTNVTTSSLSATFPLGAVAPGSYDLSVVNTANGDAGSCTACFTVTGGTPTVTSVSPATRGAGASGEVLTLTGTNFSNGSTVAFPGGITVVGEPTVTSPTSLTVTVNVPAGTTAGAANPAVTTFDGQAGTCAATCFTITAKPVVTSTSPNALADGSGPVNVTFTGTGFQVGQTPTLSLGTGITVSNVVVVSSTSVTADLSVAAGTSPGPRTVTATNPDHGTSVSAGVFAVHAPPTLTSLSETSRQSRGTTSAITLTGTGFAAGIVVSFGPGITVGAATLSDASHLSVPVTIAADAAKGTRDVTVTNTDHGSGTLVGGFTVLSNPTVASVSPSKVQRNATNVALLVSGTGLVNGATLRLPTGLTLHAGSTPTANGAGTTLDVAVDVAGTAPLGAGDLTVTNPDTGTVTKAGALTVVSDPTVTSASPSALQRNASGVALTVSGADLVTGAAVGLPTGVTVHAGSNPTANAAGTTLTLSVDIAGDAPLGAGDLTVTNPDGGTVTKAGALTVVLDPTISSVTPSSVQRGRHAFPITVNGTNLATGATVSLPPGVTLSAGSTPTANGAGTTLGFLVDVANQAPLGAGNVSVTNPDKGTVTKLSALTVAAARTFVLSLPARPVSGATQSVTLTAVDSDGTTTDTSYTGTPTLSTTDTHGTPGTCGAAVNGVASCSGTVFGDLGTQTLSATGSGNDGDLSGFKAVSVAPVSLVFTTAPTTAARGTAASFTVVPTAANGGTLTGYQATRVLVTTGGGSSPASGDALSCPGVSCTFSVTWTTGGTKTVTVTDGSAATAPASVVVPFPTALSSRLSSTVTSQQGYSTISGVLTNTQTGAPVGFVPVRIYKKVAPATSYTLVATVTTYSTGGYAYKATSLTRNSVLLVQYVGSTAYSPAKTSKLVYVRAGVTATFPASLHVSRSFTISGRTTPADPSAKVYLFERRADGRVVVIASSTVSSYGTFALTRSIGLAAGKHTVWVVVASSALNYTNATARYTITAS